MRNRSRFAALILSVVVTILLQRGVLVLPLVATLVGAVLGGVVLVALERRRDRDVVLGGAAVGLATALASMVSLAVLGAPVLAPITRSGWVITFLLAAGVAAGTVWLGGRVAESASGSPSALR